LPGQGPLCLCRAFQFDFHGHGVYTGTVLLSLSPHKRSAKNALGNLASFFVGPMLPPPLNYSPLNASLCTIGADENICVVPLCVDLCGHVCPVRSFYVCTNELGRFLYSDLFRSARAVFLLSTPLGMPGHVFVAVGPTLGWRCPVPPPTPFSMDDSGEPPRHSFPWTLYFPYARFCSPSSCAPFPPPTCAWITRYRAPRGLPLAPRSRRLCGSVGARGPAFARPSLFRFQLLFFLCRNPVFVLRPVIGTARDIPPPSSGVVCFSSWLRHDVLVPPDLSLRSGWPSLWVSTVIIGTMCHPSPLPPYIVLFPPSFVEDRIFLFLDRHVVICRFSLSELSCRVVRLFSLPFLIALSLLLNFSRLEASFGTAFVRHCSRCSPPSPPGRPVPQCEALYELFPCDGSHRLGCLAPVFLSRRSSFSFSPLTSVLSCTSML